MGHAHNKVSMGRRQEKEHTEHMNTCMKWMWVLNDYKSTCKGLWWQSLMTQTFHLQNLERAVTFKTIILSALKPQLSKTHYFHCHFIIILSLPRVTLSPCYSFHSSPVQTKISVENKRTKLFPVSNSQGNSHLERRKKGKVCCCCGNCMRAQKYSYQIKYLLEDQAHHWTVTATSLSVPEGSGQGTQPGWMSPTPPRFQIWNSFSNVSSMLFLVKTTTTVWRP